jgi:hypothetical protein
MLGAAKRLKKVFFIVINSRPSHKTPNSFAVYHEFSLVWQVCFSAILHGV